MSLPGALRFCAAGLLARAGGAMMGIGLVLMVSAIYGSYAMAGALAAVSGLAWAIGTAVLSGLVDRHGQRRIMWPAAVLCSAALLVAVVFAVLRLPVWTLFPPVAISGLSSGSPGALVRARWNHLASTPEQLHSAFSLESALDELTFVVGPVLATALSTGAHPAAALVVPAVVGLVGAQLFYSQRATEPPATPRATDAEGHRVRGRMIMAFPGVAAVVATSVLIGCAFGSIDVSVVAQATGWGVRSDAGLVLAAFSVSSGISGLLYGARSWAMPLTRRFAIGLVAMSVAGLGPVLAGNIVLLAAAGMLIGLSVAPTLINCNTLVEQLVPRARLTEGLAWTGTGLGVGVSIGSSLSGQVIDRAGDHAGFWVVAIFACGAMAIGVGSLRVVRRALAAGDGPPTLVSVEPG
nr:MFS transporter [Acidipropionibacterium jensenii]